MEPEKQTRKTRPVSRTYERIAQFIQSLQKDEFTFSELHRGLPDLHPARIGVFLNHKRKQGWVLRISRGRYAMGTAPLKLKLPASLIAEACYRVLDANRSKFLRLAEIAQKVTVLVNLPYERAYHPVNNLVSDWSLSGDLERKGKRKKYAYRLKPRITQRPVKSKNRHQAVWSKKTA